MKTCFLLLAQYDGRAIIPLARVVNDYFSHMSERTLLAKVDAGDIELPIIRIEMSAKAARGVHIQDLADYIDRRREAARREVNQIAGRA